MSGRLSSCSIVQEENIVRRMHKTPGTPIKSGYQVTPRKSESKRSLFQSNSPSNSDDLGLMSPLSPSSCSSNNTLESPNFSPNGEFSTPPRTPRTPRNDGRQIRQSPRLTSKKIEVKSSLFPDLKIPSPRSKRGSRTPRTPLSKMLTPQSVVDSLDGIDELPNTPTTTRRALSKGSFGERTIVAESDSSPSVSEDNERERSSDKPTILGIKPLSCESFYGPVPNPPKTRTKLFIDSLGPRPGARTLERSESRDSLSSNKSFVSGGTRKRDRSNSSNRVRSKSSNGDRRKPIHVGVWHNIKKPKQIRKIKNEKPLISPKSRVAKMLNEPKDKEIKVKSKPLFQENPRRRIAHSKKRNRTDLEEDDIIDSFSNSLTKNKKLPNSRFNVHPAISGSKVESLDDAVPDPNKKFVKYGQTRKATFTLTDSVKLQISDGVMRLQTPKKRRKLYSGKKDIVEDFNDFEDVENEIARDIQGILNRLQSDSSCSKSTFEADKEYNAPIFNSIENLQPKSPAKTPRSPMKSIANLPTMIMNDFDSDDDENSEPPVIQERRSSEISLAKTGNIVSLLTNILVNQDMESSPTKKSPETENSPPDQEKYYSLFYKQNWDKNLANDDGNGNPRSQSAKKKTLVPDDQYLLDAGQKSIGIITCKKCGVMYQSGDFADEATHKNFHNHLPELKFTNWNNERIVGKYPDGRVLMILSSDPKIWWQKVSKIVDIVDQELGFPEASIKSLYHKTVYLYINEKSKQIAGCLIAEECKVAYKMFPPLEGVEIDSCSKDPSPCRIGISRIWTALSYRRKGVASRMIDCLQRTFFFGEIIPLDLIAFSVPSPSGKLLAQKVTGRFDFLVYGFA